MQKFDLEEILVYHKNRSRHLRDIPNTFLESLGSILLIFEIFETFYAFLQLKRYSEKLPSKADLENVIYADIFKNAVWVAKMHKMFQKFLKLKVWILSFPKTCLECL